MVVSVTGNEIDFIFLLISDRVIIILHQKLLHTQKARDENNFGFRLRQPRIGDDVQAQAD